MQTISVIEILKHLPEPECVYDMEFLSLSSGINFCMQYRHYDVAIEESGYVYLLPAGCIKPVLIYDAYKRHFDVSGVPISPIENILKKVSSLV
mgnify:FL=1